MNILQCSIPGRAGRAEQRRDHLLETARALFVAHGFHRTGVAQIAQASGVKVGQIYRDFACKEDIIAAIALRDLSAFLDESVLAAAIAADDRAALRDWILSFVAYEEEFEGYRLMPEILAESARNPRIAAVQETINHRVHAALMSALTACAPGDARDAERAAFADLISALGVGLCQSIIMETQRGRDFRPLCASLKAIVERELDLLCAPSSP